MKAKFSTTLAILALTGLIGWPPLAMAQGTAGSSASHPSAVSDRNKVMTNRNAAENTVANATRIFKVAALDPARFIPAWVMENAVGIAIFPSVFKAAFLAGGSHGSGVLLAKQKNGEWSAPLFVSLSGGSLGAQVGVETSDLVLVFQNRSAFDKVAKGRTFTLGVDASVAVGGRTASAITQNAQVLAYKHSSGLFAGASLNGSVLKIQTEPTIAYYGLSTGESATHAYYGDKELFNSIIGPGNNGKGAIGTPKGQMLKELPAGASKLQQAIRAYTTQAKDLVK
jgi:lipid-binding SYLF domain-containing protein